MSMSYQKRLKKPAAVQIHLFIAVACLSTDARATTVELGTAGNFTVLGGTTVTNGGASSIIGNLGLSPGTSITGLAESVTGSTDINNATAAQAQADAASALNHLVSLTATQDLSGFDLGGMVLTPGVYKFSAASQLTGSVILNGIGQENPLFVFQIGSTLTTAPGASFVAINGASASNTYFQIGSSATLGTNTKFAGNLLAAVSTTVNAGTIVDGRILAAAAITLDTNQISLASSTGTTWGLTKTGSYTMNLLKSNSYSGLTTLVQGVIQVGVGSSGSVGAIESSAFGSDRLMLQGGVLSSDGTTQRTILNAITVSGNLSLGNAIDNGELTFEAAMDLSGATRTLGVDSAVVFNGSLSNGGLTKTGSGQLTLSGASTYTGSTTVSAGKLIVNGSTSASSAVGVSNGGILAGSGTVGGNTTLASGGTLAPGNSPGVLTVTGDLAFASGSIFEWELDLSKPPVETNRGVAYDGVNVGGTLSGSGAIFKIMLTGDQNFSDTFWNQTREWTDIFKTANDGDILSNWAGVFGGGFQYAYNGQTVAPTSAGSFAVSGNSLTWSAVPEPSNLLAGLLAGSPLLRRRRQR
jgi:type VI secretion system secreted protein VgrG